MHTYIHTYLLTYIHTHIYIYIYIYLSLSLSLSLSLYIYIDISGSVGMRERPLLRVAAGRHIGQRRWVRYDMRVCLTARSAPTPSPTPPPTAVPTTPLTPPPTTPPTAVPTTPPSMLPTAGELNPNNSDQRKRGHGAAVHVRSSVGLRGGSLPFALGVGTRSKKGAAMSLGRQALKDIYKVQPYMSLGRQDLAIFARRRRACTPACSASVLQHCPNGVSAKLKQIVTLQHCPNGGLVKLH